MVKVVEEGERGREFARQQRQRRRADFSSSDSESSIEGEDLVGKNFIGDGENYNLQQPQRIPLPH